MSEPATLAFKGLTSQTGQATLSEFPGINLVQGEPSLEEIIDAVKTTKNFVVLPMWNSHEGEIKKLEALDLLFQRSAKLLRLWPRSIRFECLLSKHAETSGEIHSIISVGVAKAQCSKFIEKTGGEFTSCDSTVDAYREFCNSFKFDAILSAPEQNKGGFRVHSSDVANPLNFTTFALLNHVKSHDWLPEKWGTWYEVLFPKTGVFFGVEMPIRVVSLSDDQQQLLNDLTADATRIDDIPKVVFVTRRREDSCGLLFEASDIVVDEDVITEEGYSAKINIIPEIGVYNKRYSDRAYEYLLENDNSILSNDFIRHIGTNTCFYACPPLGLITHGFEQTVVESVVRRIITKYFELFVNGMECSTPQNKFFERYKPSYLDKGPDFINFHDIGTS
jgi:hypothetical protein